LLLDRRWEKWKGSFVMLEIAVDDGDEVRAGGHPTAGEAGAVDPPEAPQPAVGSRQANHRRRRDHFPRQAL
jgi:hypothetical protein